MPGAVPRRRVERGGEVLAVDQGIVLGDAGLGHPVVDLQDEFLGAVGAVLGLVLPLHDGEGLHDVVDVITLDAVEVEEEGVQPSANYRTTPLIPSEGASQVTHVLRKSLHPPFNKGELKDSRIHKLQKRFDLTYGNNGKLTS